MQLFCKTIIKNAKNNFFFDARAVNRSQRLPSPVSTGKLREFIEVGVAFIEKCLCAFLCFVHEIIHERGIAEIGRAVV